MTTKTSKTSKTETQKDRETEILKRQKDRNERFN